MHIGVKVDDVAAAVDFAGDTHGCDDMSAPG